MDKHSLIDLLQAAALQRGLIDPQALIGPAEAYSLVRDMPYQRATDRRPETLIAEWRGTCSGKHYLLRDLFTELGYPSHVMACTSVQDLSENLIPPELHDLWSAAAGRFVDVHNYLVLELPASEMIVDATWPLGSEQYGLTVNPAFVLGQDQRLASVPLQSWRVPAGQDPQAFKETLLRQNFTPAELEFRDAFILALGNWLSEN
jgi:hypothetical protein